MACDLCGKYRVNELLQGIPLQIIDVPLATIEKDSIAHIYKKSFVKPVEKLLVKCDTQKEKQADGYRRNNSGKDNYLDGGIDFSFQFYTPLPRRF